MELADICAQLKNTRLKKNISLQDVSKQTKLHPSMLRSIEEVNSLEEVGKFYLKGFLKIYAQFLGENSLIKEIDGAFTEEKQKKPKFGFRKDQPAVKEAPKPKEPVQEAVQKTPPPAPEATTTALPPRPKPKFNKRTLYVVIAVIALITVARIAGRNKGEKPETGPKQAESLKARPTNPKIFQQQDSARPLASILTKGDVLVEVRTDGKLVFQNIIIKGTKESWMADEKLEVKISNPSLVSLEIDNRIIPTSNTKRPALYLITSEGFRVEK